ncbi:MAG: DUF6538 domain-containing protein [Pseudomonadota bacterium]
MVTNNTDHLIKLRGKYHYKRRVPTALIGLVGKKFVQKSTGTSNRTEAGLIAREIDAENERYWATLRGDGDAKAEHAYDKARKRANALQLDYRTADELAAGPLEEILRRVEQLEQNGLLKSPPAVEAVLGGVEKPKILLSSLFERYEAINRADLRRKAPDQLRKWRNPHIKAVNSLIALIGDKPIDQITRSDALSFREWWQNRVVGDRMDPGSANKDIGHLNKMINEVSDYLRLELERPFAGLRLKGERHNPRLPYPTEFIRDALLAPGALDGLNEEARLAFYMMVETGMGPSEVTSLSADRIKLDVEIPYIVLKHLSEEEDGRNRQLKTDNREREIPLLGVSLLAAQRLMRVHGGFPKYADCPDNLSAAINKFLRENDLVPPNGATVYGLRHAFQDRFNAVEPPERINADIFGHRYYRPKYGKGASLEQKRDWLAKITFDVADRLPSACLAMDAP